MKRVLPLLLVGALSLGAPTFSPLNLRPAHAQDDSNEQWDVLSRKVPRIPATVRAAQYLLRARGVRVIVDGKFGVQTEAAVKRFQRAQELTTDGVIGAQTWPRLCPILRRGSRGDAVRALQVLINNVAQSEDSVKPVKVDGLFGAGTERALRRVQRVIAGYSNRRGETGVADERTWIHLTNDGFDAFGG